MKSILLDGPWEFCIAETNEWMPAVVPGSVYTDLLRCNKIENPYWADNAVDALQWMENDFVYRCRFMVDQQWLSGDTVRLRCEGLDTVADLLINGILIAHTENMHRTWVFDVISQLRPGENELEIRFFSPTKYIRAAYLQNPADGAEECLVGFPTLRKAHCMFGWDWAPRLPDAGIWRNITLEIAEIACIEEVQILQHHENEMVRVQVIPQVEELRQGCHWTCEIFMITPDGRQLHADADGFVTVQSPQLWWPNGYGGQPLYEVHVVILYAGQTLDRWTRKIGLRTVTMHIEKDAWGVCFAHCVNGVDIFAMGADYIPEDSLFGQRTPERTRRLLEDCILANYNTIRVWGGGVYPDDTFYECCDELGLLVWQDLMFACAVYNLTEAFEENIKQEIIDNLRRIRHHACLGLLCGNNEMELFVEEGKWVSSSRQKADYIKMYEYLFPKLAKQHAPQTFYWPASPSSGGSFDHPNAADRGDVHFWEVWHGNKPFSEYQNHYFRYLSEFGFESFPCKKTIDSFAPVNEQNAFSYVMETHQRKPGANGKIISYLAQTFLYPTNFEMLLYASQLLQAEAVRYGVEHLRRHRGRCMGTIYWQANDCWPVASWSSIDYFGRWKALHYDAKRFFSPILLSAQITSAFTKDPDINQQQRPEDKSARFFITNETRNVFVGTIEWQLCRTDNAVIRQGVVAVEIPALCSQPVCEVDASDLDALTHYLSYRLLDQQQNQLSYTCSLFCPPKYFAFPDPGLKVWREQNAVCVQAGAIAKSVAIDAPGTELLLEDNFFDMPPGIKRIPILRGVPDALQAYSVYDIR